MSEKKPYTAPQVFQVDLDKDQAVLTACSILTGALNLAMGNTCRSIGGLPCKRGNKQAGGDGDMGPRQS